MRAPPDAANRMNGRALVESRPRAAVTIASPAAMPSEPPMKSKSCTATVTGMPSSVPSPTLIASCMPVLACALLQPVGVALLVAELQRIQRHLRQRHIVVTRLDRRTDFRRCAAVIRMW